MNVDDLPQALMRDILLRLPVKSLLLLRCVCKTWLHLISDPTFARSHFELAPTLSRRCCLFIHGRNALSFDLDSLFHDAYAPPEFALRLPCDKPSDVYVQESCRGFILLDQYPHFIIWNPLTGARKQISYPHVASNAQRPNLFRSVLLCGFGYDPSKDDYMVALAWRDHKNKQDHFDLFSVRNSSWENFGAALPLLDDNVERCGVFLNGALHWLVCSSRLSQPILVFDLMERSFSEIPLPLPVAGNSDSCCLVELGGCLAFYFWSGDERVVKIWVMKEYKVQSSWTSYAISDIGFLPIGSSNDGNIIGFDYDDDDYFGYAKYNFSGELLHHTRHHGPYDWCTVYRESLLSLPSDS